jgi:hypothetical protein
MGDNTSSNETTFIYALVDPRTKQIRYVGKADNPYERLVDHLREKGALDKNKWIYDLLAEGQQPELRILEEVSMHPPYMWQERERWWIFHLRRQGTQLTNVVFGGENTLRREASSYIPRHRKWKGHYKPSESAVKFLFCHLASGQDDIEMSNNPGYMPSPFTQNRQYTWPCTRLPTGTAIIVGGSDWDSLFEYYATWFCRCTIAVPHTLPLGIFPIQVSVPDGENNNFAYPTEPGLYECYIWKEQAQDSLDAGCRVAVLEGLAWEEWTRDNQAFLSLCRELWQYFPVSEESDKLLKETDILYYLARYLMATPPYPEMLHWFSYAVMQLNRSWYHATINAQI